MAVMDSDFPTKMEEQLINAFNEMESKQEFMAFLRDVFSRAEIKEAAKRLEIARQLYFSRKPYAEIAQELETSTTTVTRANDWLRNKGMEGFKTALERLFPDQEPVER